MGHWDVIVSRRRRRLHRSVAHLARCTHDLGRSTMASRIHEVHGSSRPGELTAAVMTRTAHPTGEHGYPPSASRHGKQRASIETHDDSRGNSYDHRAFCAARCLLG